MRKDFVIEVPEELLKLNEQKLIEVEYINSWKDFLERRLYINSEIDDTVLDLISYYIGIYNSQDIDIPIENRKVIKIFINSDGGGLYEGMHIADIIKLSKTPVWTICQSRAYSSGGIIFIAGHKRFCYPSSSFLLHSGNVGVGGRTDSVFDNIEFSKEYEKRVKDLFIKNTKISDKKYIENYRREWFMDSEEMLRYGICDEICSNIIF